MYRCTNWGSSPRGNLSVFSRVWDVFRGLHLLQQEASSMNGRRYTYCGYEDKQKSLRSDTDLGTQQYQFIHQGLCPLQRQVVSSMYSTRHQVPHMEWALSLIRQLLVIPKVMMPLPHHWWHLFGLTIIVIWLFSLLVAFIAPSGTMRVGPQGRGFWVRFSFISQSPVPEVCGACCCLRPTTGS